MIDLNYYRVVASEVYSVNSLKGELLELIKEVEEKMITDRQAVECIEKVLFLLQPIKDAYEKRETEKAFCSTNNAPSSFGQLEAVVSQHALRELYTQETKQSWIDYRKNAGVYPSKEYVEWLEKRLGVSG
jgi:hypothetical protein